MVTQERLKELLSYDPVTGNFTRLVTVNNANRAGSQPGTITDDGYVRIRIDGQPLYGHVLAWLYMTGEWPVQVDHKNRNRADNSWENLRHSNQSQNCGNRTPQIGTSGFAGVTPVGNKFQAQITMSGKVQYLGLKDTAEEAHEVYKQAHVSYHGEFSPYYSEVL